MDLLQRQSNESNFQSVKSFNKNNLITLSFPLNFNNANISVKSLKNKGNNGSSTQQRISLTNSTSLSGSYSLNKRRGIRTAPSESIYEPSISNRLVEIRNDLVKNCNNEIINASIGSRVEIHQKIMNIGENLHESVIEKIRNEFDYKFKLKQKELEASFERDKIELIELEREKFDKKIVAIKNEIKVEYNQILKDKITENEIFNENVAREQIELFKLEARSNLEMELKKLRQELEPEKIKSINEAIIIEKKLANRQLEDQRKIYEKKISDLNDSWMKKLAQSLSDQEAQLKTKFDLELRANNEVLNQAKIKDIDNLNQMYEKKIDELKQIISVKINEINQLNLNIIDLNSMNEDLKIILNNLRLEFKSCIERFTHLNKEEAEFLFPMTKDLNKHLFKI